MLVLSSVFPGSAGQDSNPESDATRFILGVLGTGSLYAALAVL